MQKLKAAVIKRLEALAPDMTARECVETLNTLHFIASAPEGTAPVEHPENRQDVEEKDEKPAGGRSRSRSSASDEEKDEKPASGRSRSRSRASSDEEKGEKDDKPASGRRSRSRASSEDKPKPKFDDVFDEVFDLYDEAKRKGLRASIIHKIGRKVWEDTDTKEDFEDIEDFKNLKGGGVDELLEVKRLLQKEIDNADD